MAICGCTKGIGKAHWDNRRKISMFKRTCAIILTLALLTGLMFTDSLAVEATSGTIVQSGDWEYTVADDGTARIVGFCGTATNVVVPNQIDGYQVTTIATYAFYDCDTLENITLPEGLIRIGSFAFSYCNNLINITLPESLEEIYSYAFDGCENLQSVLLPEGLKVISDYAFRGCSSIKSITLPQGVNSIETGVFSGCSSLTNVVISAKNVTWREGSTFKGCSSLTSITLPEGITGIPAYSFDGCSSLQEIIVPESVTYIGKYAFSNCTSLQSIMLSDNVNSIGEYAFSGCSSLKSMQLPKKLTKINTGTFDGCTKLKNITFSEELSEIGDCAFSECSNLTNIVLPQKLTRIGGSAFFNCYGLTNIVLPEGITRIEYGTFYGCLYLSEITIPDNLKSIGESAFQYCTRLTSITLPDSVTSIGEGAFYHCKRLESIILPKGVTSIESRVFQGCSGLKEIVVSDSVTSIGSRAFADCSSLESIILPESVISVDYQAFYMCDNVTIYGYADSYAQTYAIENEIPFKYVYWVTYDACGGTEAPTTHVKLEDKSVNLSENIPNYEEHKFLGWSTCPAGKIEYLPGENYNENANLELYAVWDAGHTVTYDANDGTNELVTQTKYYGEVLQLKNPIRDGYTFKGWSTEPTGDILYQPGMNYEKDEDITLYAIWVKTYYVSYDTNGGSETLTTQYFEVNETVQISQKIPSRIGYIFLGWSDTPSGEVSFQPGDFYSQNKDVTLYAIWEKGFIVTYDANNNGGSGSYWLEDQTKRKGETLILTDVIPLRTGYVFSGWSTTPDGSVVYASSAAYKEDSDMTLYAQWVHECYLCDGIGYLYEKCSSCGADGTIKEFVYCTTCAGIGKVLTKKQVTVPCLLCEQTGIVWENNYSWYKCLCCDGKGSYQTEQDVEVTCPTCNGFKGGIQEVDCSKCYGGTNAKDCPGCGNIYGVSYSANGGDGAPKYQYKNEDVALALSHVIPYQEGCVFRGWSTTSDGSVEYQPGQTYLNDEDLRLYAVWTRFGDCNNDNRITDADAEWLLMYTFFPDDYPVNQGCDYNGDGKVNDADAEHLLMYTFFPEDYPLSE